MDSITYDITKLNASGEIDAENAVSSCGNAQEYFDKLTMFAEDSKNYLNGFNPMVVVYMDETRVKFLNEMHEIRATLNVLGMKKAASGMSYLEDAVSKKEQAILATELMEFNARMKIMTDYVVSARITGS